MTTDAPDISLGQTLRHARQTAGLTEQDIAQRLRLRPHLVAAMEADDFAALGASVYARGYLQAYTRLLGLPDAAVQTALAAHAASIAPPPLQTSHPVRPQTRISDAGMRRLGQTMAAGVLLYLGWLGYDQIPMFGPATETPLAQVRDNGVLHVPLNLPERPGSEATPATPAPPAPVLTDSSPTLSSVAVAAERISTPGAPPERLSAVETVPDPEERLRLDFGKTSWARVSDAEGKVLLNGVIRPGVRDLNGQAPFTVMLGNPKTVQISLNDTPIDRAQIPPLRNSRSVRFTVGATSNSEG